MKIVRTCRTAFVGLLSIGGLLATPVAAAAEPFTFELGAAYDHSEFTSSGEVIIGLNPIQRRPFRIVTDDDATRLSAVWYYDGAHAGDGPLSRAAFTSRASSLGLSFVDSDGGGIGAFSVTPIAVLPDPPIVVPSLPDPPIFLPDPPPFTPIALDPPSTDSTQLSLDARHVFKSSGWYLFGSASHEDIDTGGFDSSAESTRLLAGFGRYLGKTTSLDLAVLHVDSEVQFGLTEFSDSTTEWLLGLTHIGDWGGSWQYGVDLAISTVERFGDDGSVSLRGSLYPNRSVAVGIDVVTSIESALDEGTRYGAFVSWFATPRFEVFAEVSTIEPLSNLGLKSEEDSYGIGIRLRL